MKAKPTIVPTALLVAALLFLTFAVSRWWGVPYVLLGIFYGRKAGMRWALPPFIGDLFFGLIWGLHVAMACCMMCAKPYRNKNILQMLPLMNDLFAHHLDGNYRYDHGFNKPKS